MQRFVYVELEKGVKEDRVVEAIRAEPLFIGEETWSSRSKVLPLLSRKGVALYLNVGERRGN
jgi:hypothetical protein